MATFECKEIVIIFFALYTFIKILSSILTHRIICKAKFTTNQVNVIYQNEEAFNQLKKNLKNMKLWNIFGEITCFSLYSGLLCLNGPEYNHSDYRDSALNFFFNNFLNIWLYSSILTYGEALGIIYYIFKLRNDPEKKNYKGIQGKYFINSCFKISNGLWFLYYLLSFIIIVCTKKYTAMIIWISFLILHILLSHFTILTDIYGKKIPLLEIDTSISEKIQSILLSEKVPLSDLLIIAEKLPAVEAIRTKNLCAFGFNKIAISERLFKKLSNDEIVSMLYHQIHHYKNTKTKSLFCLEFITSTFKFLMFLFFQRFIYNDMEAPLFIVYIYFLGFFSIFNLMLNFFINAIYRSWEDKADKFAVIKSKSTHLETALKKIYLYNHMDIYFSKLEELLKHGCSRLEKRIENIHTTYKEIQNKDL